MAAPPHNINYTYAEYLALEASSNIKHEFLGGQIYAMARGTPEHAALAAAVIGLLFAQLRGATAALTMPKCASVHRRASRRIPMSP